MAKYKFWRRKEGHPPKDHVRIARLTTGEHVRYDLAITGDHDEYMRVTIWDWEYLGEGVIHSIDGKVL